MSTTRTTRRITVRTEPVKETRRVRRSEAGCWEDDNECSGERIINEHAGRLSWWLVGVLLVVALILVGVTGQHAYATQLTGPWSTLHASSWIQPTPRALASLVGITIALDLYTSYMMALKRGHLDRHLGQFLLTSFIRVGLWIFFMEGVAYGGTIGSMLALITLALVLVWGVLSSHSCAPLHTWISILELVFVFYLMCWLGTTGAKVLPQP